MGKSLIRVCLAVLAVSLLAACQPTPTAEPTGEATEAPATGEPTTEPTVEAGPTATPSAPDVIELQAPVPATIRLDPANAEDAESITINAYLYSTLVTAEGETVSPALAESWIVSEDGLNYTFTLRGDAFFSDGSQVDADAVIDNFTRWFDPASPLRGDQAYAGWEAFFLGFKGETNADGTPVSPVDGIEKIDNRTFVIHLNRPTPTFLVDLAQSYFAIVNPDVLASTGADYGTQAGGASGSGPYFIAEWTDEHIVLWPYNAYWGEVPTIGLEFQFQ